MNQAVPKLTFAFVSDSNYKFSRISAIAATKRGNVIICDQQLKAIVLVDENGRYLNHIPTYYTPWDVCVDNLGVAYVTFPFEDGRVETFYSDKLLSTGSLSIMSSDISTIRPFAISHYNGLDLRVMTSMLNKFNQDEISFEKNYFGKKAPICTVNTTSSSILLQGYQSKLHSKRSIVFDPRVDKFLCYYISRNFVYRCEVSHELFSDFDSKIENQLYICSHSRIDVPQLKEPSDVCSDNKGHIYIADQYSHDIHRMTEEGDVVDIPLTKQNGVKYPVAICFNKEYTKFYVANDWGKSLLVYNVQ